jgi:hypothetical protein
MLRIHERITRPDVVELPESQEEKHEVLAPCSYSGTLLFVCADAEFDNNQFT